MADSRTALVFDLDGTLVDSLADLRNAINRLLGELGKPHLALSEARIMLGDGANAFVRRALASRGMACESRQLDAFVGRYLEFYATEPVRETRPFPGVPETLQRLLRAGYRCAVCTNKPKRMAEAVLEGVKLAAYVEAVVCPEDIVNKKPHPEHLAAAIAAIGGRPSSAIMIGDSANDVRPARALGMPVIVVEYGYSLEPADSLGADLVLRCFADLEAALKGWARGRA
jgi:phosphoglycolate phosphatase